ncbi:MAG: hypothetical protein RRB13_10720 [bacterium]|nr:hypothetical protein [bacterium]
MYNAQQIHDAPLILRQKLKDHASAKPSSGSSQSNGTGPLGSPLEFRFGRILSLEERCRKRGAQILDRSALSIEAWLFDDQLDPQVLQDQTTIGDQLSRFQSFFYAGEVYEALHPYIQSLGLLNVLVTERQLNFRVDRVVVNLELEAESTATEKLISQKVALLNRVNPGSYSKATAQARADPASQALVNQFALAAQQALGEGA